MMKPTSNLSEKAINTVRILAVDAVQKANSGHPGMPMGAAPMAHVLFTEFMNYNPKNSHWPNRDRFILSAGHGCMLQYALLHLTGYAISMEDIKNFRQLDSHTPGHPEYGLTDGIDVTTGPLGQGFANGVGFGIGQKHLASRFNKPGFELFDYKIYVICSDGDLMEGVTAEAASLAGHLELGNLIYLYDDNHISIEGNTDIAFTEDVAARFEAYGWHVQVVEDGNDIKAIEFAVRNAKAELQKPSFIQIRTQIAYGSPNKVNSASAHGSPLGEEEVKLVKEFFGFNPSEFFHVPEDVAAYYRNIGESGVAKEAQWKEMFENYRERFPELSQAYSEILTDTLPQGWKEHLPLFEGKDPLATRQASGKVLNAIAAYLPGLMGGSADLAPSTDTNLKEFDSFTPEKREGRNFHFGVREHAMGSILNGMSLTKGIIAYGATFLIFSDYMRPAIRLAAIMKIRPIFIYTHDSIGLGEDGTTHQPVEQLISLRAIPNVTLIRPADANETREAWRVALEHKDGPVVIVLTRQALPILDQQKYGSASGLAKGAYILSDEDDPELLLMGTGSEVSLLLAAKDKLAQAGIKTRVISMPSWELFEQQDEVYKEGIFPRTLKKRMAVEAGSPLGWHKYITDEGEVIGMNGFGESAPAAALFKKFGFTTDHILERAQVMLGKI